MSNRVLVLNFKNYSEVLGEGALRLASAAQKVSAAVGVDIVVAPPSPMLGMVALTTKIPVFAQRAELAPEGKSTGLLIPEAIRAAGGKGSIINHSESRLPIEMIRQLLPKMKALGLMSCVCTEHAAELGEIAVLAPDYLAIEPPELIGTGVAVSKAKPDLITESIWAARRASYKGKLLCGAGIVSGEDVRSAVRLGTHGILVASSVVKATDWEAKLTELAQALAA